MAVTKLAPERFKSWNVDSGSIEHMTPDTTALIEHQPVAPGDMVEVVDKTLLPGVAMALTAAPEAEKSMEDLSHLVAYIGKDG